MALCSKHLLFAFVICLGSVIVGDIGAYTSPTSSQIRDVHHLSDQDFKWSFYCSIAYLTSAFGPFATKFLLKIFKGKRKQTMFVIAAYSLVSWLLNCLVKINIYAGWMSRALLGISMGSFSSITAMYLVEIAPADVSGFFGSLNTIAIFIGQAAFSFLGPFIDYMGLNYLAVAVSALLSITIWFIPESPLISSSPLIETPKVSVFQKKYLKSFFVGISMMFLQQFSGISGILANLADIFRGAGIDMDPNYQSGISILFLLVGNFAASFMIDKLGQKKQWIIASTTAFIGTFIMSLNDKFNWSAILSLICIFVYNLGFGLGLGPIPWFIVFDLFEEDVREMANAICIVSNWVFAFLIVMIFPSMKKSMGMFGVMLFFSAICFLGIVFGFKFVQNSDKSKKVSDIEESSDNDYSN